MPQHRVACSFTVYQRSAYWASAGEVQLSCSANQVDKRGGLMRTGLYKGMLPCFLGGRLSLLP